MNHCYIPEGYRNPLNVYETQRAIEFIKQHFLRNLCHALNLKRVSAPLFVEEASGLNDNLNGYERPVSFDVPAVGAESQVVHSLAKWKRYALKRYNFYPGNGLVTDMNAIRRDEDLDNIHSIYVDQWDWEKVIRPEDRTLDFLKQTVRRIYEAIKVTENKLFVEFPQIVPGLPEEIHFITAQELLDRYPDLSAKDREHAVTKEYGAVFIIGIGDRLSDGNPHDGRAADYDDWSLNGDLLVWDDILGRSLELSSMGIRVNAESMLRQLAAKGEESKKELYYHSRLLAGELPQTIGGGIGQSRLCMFLLRKAHIGEIQSSIWPAAMRTACEEAGIHLM